MVYGLRYLTPKFDSERQYSNLIFAFLGFLYTFLAVDKIILIVAFSIDVLKSFVYVYTCTSDDLTRNTLPGQTWNLPNC